MKGFNLKAKRDSRLYFIDPKDKITFKGQILYRLYFQDTKTGQKTKGGYCWSVNAVEDFAMVNENAILAGSTRLMGNSSLEDTTVVEGEVNIHNCVFTGQSRVFGYGSISSVTQHSAFLSVTNHLKLWQVLAGAPAFSQDVRQDDSIPQSQDG